METRTTEQKAVEKKRSRAMIPHFLRSLKLKMKKISSFRTISRKYYKVRLDDTDPYAFGMGKEWFVMNDTLAFHTLQQAIILVTYF